MSDWFLARKEQTSTVEHQDQSIRASQRQKKHPAEPRSSRARLFGTVRRLSSPGTRGVWEGDLKDGSTISDLLEALGTTIGEDDSVKFSLDISPKRYYTTLGCYACP